MSNDDISLAQREGVFAEGERAFKEGKWRVCNPYTASSPTLEQVWMYGWDKEFGVTALFQNHSPSGRSRYVGAVLSAMEQALEGINPDQFGIAFDIGHALVVHGAEWRLHYEKLKPFIRIVYVKDWARGKGWVPFGAGDVAATDFFKLLKSSGYAAPVSLHIEFDWDQKGKNKDRPTLLKALRASTETLRGWLKSA